MSLEIPSLLARELGATHVVSVWLPPSQCRRPPANVFQVIRRCFQIMQDAAKPGGGTKAISVITPDLKAVESNGFEGGRELLNAGEEAALSTIQAWRPRRGRIVATPTVRESFARSPVLPILAFARGVVVVLPTVVVVVVVVDRFEVELRHPLRNLSSELRALHH